MDSSSEFINTCKQHHLKVTPQRTAIFRIIADSEDHPSADMVFKQIHSEFPNISFDTVNRTLLTFAEIGIIDIAEGHGKPRQFDPNLKPHHHFFCTQCGKITDFYCRTYDDLDIPEDIQKKFTINTRRVVLKGICDVCREKNDKTHG